jgi:3-hydroxyacyl-[acyl-carrier-protein] dehydratase
MDTATATQTYPMSLDAVQIMNIIPHRYPIIMVDKAVIHEPKKKITGYKSVAGNEPVFTGHFPGRPIMPGVLIVEAKDKLAFFMGIDGVKFRKPVVPGDQLEMRVEVLRAGGRIGKCRGEAFVNNEKVTEAEFTFAVVDKEAAK